MAMLKNVKTLSGKNQNLSVVSGKAPNPVGLYPHARKSGNLLFLSGVGPRRRGASKIPRGIEAQCHSVFRNVKFILEQGGSSWDKIVDVTVYLTNMKRDFPVYNRLWAEYFKKNPPCRTTVEVNCLPTPISIELKVIAQIK